MAIRFNVGKNVLFNIGRGTRGCMGLNKPQTKLTTGICNTGCKPLPTSCHKSWQGRRWDLQERLLERAAELGFRDTLGLGLEESCGAEQQHLAFLHLLFAAETPLKALRGRQRAIHRAVESSRLEKTFEATKSNHHPSSTTKPWPQLPHPNEFLGTSSPKN